jgi:hypothetical protein
MDVGVGENWLGQLRALLKAAVAFPATSPKLMIPSNEYLEKLRYHTPKRDTAWRLAATTTAKTAIPSITAKKATAANTMFSGQSMNSK